MANLIKISEAASLGLHTMAILANRQEGRATSQEIAGLLGASVHHLAKVMQRLVRAGLVDSTVGPRGGFVLAKPAGRIKLLDIYEVIEGPLGKPECLLADQICSGDDCLLGDLVHRLNGEIRTYLKQTTLAALAKNSAFVKGLEKIETRNKEAEN